MCIRDSYSRAGEQNNEKSMIFEPPEPARPRFEPSQTNTFQWFSRAPARPRAPPRRKKGTLRDAREGKPFRACPTMQIHRTCRPRARQGPCKNLPIIPIGTEIGLIPLESHRTCRPRAWPVVRAWKAEVSMCFLCECSLYYTSHPSSNNAPHACEIGGAGGRRAAPLRGRGREWPACGHS